MDFKFTYWPTYEAKLDTYTYIEVYILEEIMWKKNVTPHANQVKLS